MYRISKEFHFSASHQLVHLPEGHQCARLHGHNYVVVVELTAEKLDPSGFVMDYGLLDPFGDWIKAVVDHRHLNDVVAAYNHLSDPNEAAKLTTAENLARWFYESLAQWAWGETQMAIVPSAVTVKETAKTAAEYRTDHRVTRTIPFPPKDGNRHG